MPSSEDRFVKRTKVEESVSRPFRSRTVPKKAVSSQPPLRAVSELPMQRAAPNHLAQRAIKRQEFDTEQKQKAEELWCMRREDDLAHALREEQDIKHLREGLVFRAKPIHKYSSLCVHRSQRRLTEPKSPALLTARRAELHNLALM